MINIDTQLKVGISKDELLEAIGLIPNNARIKVKDGTLFVVTQDDRMKSIGEATNSIAERTFEIWMEGFMITGGGAKAVRITAGAKGRTFTEAVKSYYRTHPDSNFNPDTLSVWGCKLYPTETEARKAFG